MKLLIGGSPCTHWSIAQTKNRETEPEGLGWELFKNYLIALEKFKPDFRDLKIAALSKAQKGADCIYIGIAVDEPARFHNLTANKKSPLVDAGWTEGKCRQWCEENGLLSPIYTDSARGGCWFCHNQGLQQLRLLRRNYPAYWKMMLEWDSDSAVPFRTDGHTVHDLEQRFQLEDQGLISPDDRVFRWSMLEEPLNYRLF